MTKLLVLTILVTFSLYSSAVILQQPDMNEPPPGYWTLAKSQPIIDKTQSIRLAPDLSQLSAGARRAIDKLLQVGLIFQAIYEEQRHVQALSSLSDLLLLDKKSGSSATTRNLLALYRLNQGPIATSLDNKREAFLPVGPPVPEKNVYPPGVNVEIVDAFLAAHPEKKDELMHSRTVVRRANPGNLQRDLSMLKNTRYLICIRLDDRVGGTASDPVRRQTHATVPSAGNSATVLPEPMQRRSAPFKAGRFTPYLTRWPTQINC
jgi:hypothetical protein